MLSFGNSTGWVCLGLGNSAIYVQLGNSTGYIQLASSAIYVQLASSASFTCVSAIVLGRTHLMTIFYLGTSTGCQSSMTMLL